MDALLESGGKPSPKAAARPVRASGRAGSDRESIATVSPCRYKYEAVISDGRSTSAADASRSEKFVCVRRVHLKRRRAVAYRQLPTVSRRIDAPRCSSGATAPPRRSGRTRKIRKGVHRVDAGRSTRNNRQTLKNTTPSGPSLGPSGPATHGPSRSRGRARQPPQRLYLAKGRPGWRPVMVLRGSWGGRHARGRSPGRCHRVFWMRLRFSSRRPPFMSSFGCPK